MFVGIESFRAGETISKLVLPGMARKMRKCGGWQIRDGMAKPDNLPTRVSTTALGGVIPQQVPIAFRDTAGVRVICRDADEKVRVMGVNGVWGAAGDVIDVIGASAPVRLGSLVVFATEGADAKLVAFEPDSATTKIRPLSLKSPLDYNELATLTATPSAAPGVQFFDLAVAETDNPDSHFELATDIDNAMHFPGADYEILRFSAYECPAGTLCFKYNLSAAGIDLTGKKYLVLDLASTYVGTDPNSMIVQTGEFINSDQTTFASGYEFVLFADTACTQTIRRYAIPRLDGNERAARTKGIPRTAPPSRVNRVVIHLGTLSNTIIKGLGIRTADYFKISGLVGHFYYLWLYSFAFVENWEFKGNLLLPEVTWKWSPWFDDIPPDPGTEGNSASVVESFPPSLTNFTPDHPLVRYAYCFRAKDALSVGALYNQMLSNPSLHSASVFADPWRTYSLSITLPTNAGGNDVIDDYGDYVTHALIYAQTYSGLGLDELTNELGVWSDFRYIGRVPIAASMTYTDQGKVDVACTMNAATDTVSSTAHQLNVGDCIIFGSTTGGVSEDTVYFVIAVPNANTFQFSVEPEGSAFNVTADGANTWTAEIAELTLDGKDLPEIMELNHDYADSAKYTAVADGRVYAVNLTWNNSSNKWTRPLILMVSSFNDYGSFPTTPSDDYIETDGEELGQFSPDAMEIRSLLVKNDIKYIHTDNGFYELVGRDAQGGWQFLRRERIGAVSGKTVVDCRTMVIWHDGGHFYGYNGELAQPISDESVDSALIDWTQSHGFVFSKDRYVGFCYYNDPDEATPWALFIYDLATGAWQRRHSTAYELAGICVADASGTVYGLTHDGDVVSVFGGVVDYGGSPIWVLDTQYLEVPDGREHRASHLVLKALTTQASLNLTIDIYSRGRKNNSDTGRTLAIGNARQNYLKGDFDIDLVGDAFRIVLTYSGSTPPTIFTPFGIMLDSQPVEEA